MFLEYRSERRGYIIWLDRDLYGAYVLFRQWYGLRNRRGGKKSEVFAREEDALRKLRRIIRTRERHGYARIR
ncbi:hypothetical protein Hthe01_18610 [Hydrogenophilus thermoluteolus]|uniref:WGR domain-containing protein n=1 Tax=Hydrogenophilus thermoluteolus TaxID=297 RepID=UPI0024A26F15|nr:WGR domain-containing protein [Hydrogenophilus thermoluteolus]GLW61512.1 hypothetical protein Hthe01_18610 [Hydrogenophilus thermoluteolus]